MKAIMKMAVRNNLVRHTTNGLMVFADVIILPNLFLLFFISNSKYEFLIDI